MKNIFFIIFFSLSPVFAYFSVEDNYYKQVQVLKSLDIDMSFFQDKAYLSMKEDMGQFKNKQFIRILENGTEFVPMLKDMIKEAGIPNAFLYLAMVESEFSAKAYSKADASGLWQFIASTGKIYGLEIDEYIDERRDPIKSTQAAIKFLQHLHNKFGKWYLAALAYNCGEGRVSRAIKRAGTDDLMVLLDEKEKYLPPETRNYIRKIVMMAHLSENMNFILENEADYLLNSGSTQMNFEQIKVRGGTSLGAVADSIDMSISQLLNYNHHLNYFFTPPNKDTYHIYIPYDKKSVFARNFDAEKADSKFYLHIVQGGDSFYKISKKYNMDQKIIKDFNNINSDVLKIGQKLIIPASDLSKQYYVIKEGDTLLSISAKYNTNVETIMQTNNLKDSRIFPGGKLAIPVTF